ncbi:MAG: hypothetical protein R3E02_01520 [Blastomonas sp.]
MALMVATLASPALASVDGLWVNPEGKPTLLRAQDDDTILLKPGTRSLAEIIRGFQQLCVTTNFDKLATNIALFDNDWGFSYIPVQLETKSGEVDLGGWQADDAALLMAKDVFFSPNPQCTLTVETAERYPAYELLDAMRNALGDPDDYKTIRLPNGEVNPDFRPIWTIAEDDELGPTRIIPRSLSNGKGGYRIHITLMQFRSEVKP